jgi:hypothetical protein
MQLQESDGLIARNIKDRKRLSRTGVTAIASLLPFHDSTQSREVNV